MGSEQDDETRAADPQTRLAGDLIATARVVMRRERFAEAEQLLREFLAIREELLAPDDLQTVQARELLEESIARQGC